jgi:hypothetical protein
MKFAIEISQVGSNKWTEISKAASGRSLNWKVAGLQTGQYVIRVTTSRGHESKLLTPFTISNPPSITSQPKDASACEGGQVRLAVTADGAGLKYQWRKAGTNIPGATADTLIIPALDAASLGKYDVVISGTCSPNVTSAQATVAFGTATVITQQPSAVTVDLDKPFTLTVAATGSTLTYQWKKDGAAIPGATTATYTVGKAATSDNGLYVCEVTGGCGVVSTTPVSVVVQDPSSVDEASDPNTYVLVTGAMPVQDVLTMRIASLTGGLATIELLDVQGRVVQQQNLGVLQAGIVDVQIPVSGFSAGAYSVRIAVGATILRTHVVVR